MFPRNIKEKKISGDTQIPFKPFNQSKTICKKGKEQCWGSGFIESRSGSSISSESRSGFNPDPGFQ
jgi:hypothetical protein